MTHIRQRRDTAVNWTAQNPVLDAGEAGHETTGKWKIGDGVTPWNSLPYKNGVDTVAGRSGNVVLTVADVAGAVSTASPAFTGNPTAPTPDVSDNDTSIATTAFVKNQNFAPLASPAFTGVPTAPTQAVAANGTSIATTAFVKNQGYATLVSPAFTGAPTAPTQASTDNSTRIATTAFAKSLFVATDSGLTLDPNVASTGTGHRVYKRNGMVTLYLNVQMLISWNTTWSLASVPTGYRPVLATPGVASNQSTGAPCHVLISSTGSITIPHENLPANSVIRMAITYPHA